MSSVQRYVWPGAASWLNQQANESDPDYAVRLKTNIENYRAKAKDHFDEFESSKRRNDSAAATRAAERYAGMSTLIAKLQMNYEEVTKTPST